LRGMGILRDKRKRRVGVTARSRLIVGNQATGTPQIATEIAAPLVSRTPRGTVAAATTECGWKRGDTDTGCKQSGRKPFPGNRGSKRGRDSGKGEADGALEARMRRCLKLRQGASPLRPPAPFPSDLIIRKGGSLSRVRYAGLKNRPPWTGFLPSEETMPVKRERGPWEGRLSWASRWSAVNRGRTRGPHPGRNFADRGERGIREKARRTARWRRA
jgi:hypothetical protein